ncbi:Sister chromatid cohesion 1 protein 1 [Rhynchospora pubera]|uniref:Sister chromatid cohesion 1 protein 1 n=1 Tax=Rhynchospora pubera TaxID=906938 RepID=A0AAV8ESD0_9POAL|nr:Sister chromatid cohesion 1 protein 1 [Rhynchospora pubera]
MFYSHQLLARKTPIGQIWMAATMRSRMISRKKLYKINLVQICEELMYPAAPMALRLSGILMGGVVIVYERKVKLLLDDGNRLMDELNGAWKLKTGKVCKGKAKARYETVTLPEPDYMDIEVEPTLPGSDAPFITAGLNNMRLDEQYIHIDIDDEDLSASHHQARAEDITLGDNNHPGFEETFHHDHFERFDVREEDVPNFMPSPPRYDDEVPADNTTMRPSPSQPPEDTWHDDAMPFKSANPQGGSPMQQDEQAPKDDTPVRAKAPRKRATRRNVSKLQIDNEEILVPSAVYKSWIDDTSDIVSKRRSISSKRRRFNQVLQHQNLTTLMELPPVAIVTAYEFSSGFYYPKALMELWQESTRPMQPNRDIPAEAQHPQNTTNIPEEFYHQDLPEFPPEMFPDDVRQYNPDDSVERMRNDPGQHSNHFTPSSPGNYAQSAQSGQSSGSGPTLPVGDTEMIPTGRSRSKKRQQSSLGGSHLETVEEEGSFMAAFKLPRVSEEGPTHETETLMETGPTQTAVQSTSSDDSADPTTSAMRFQLKAHFEAPGAPKHESLSQLAQGMNPSQAAKLFYQTCVLATRRDLKIEQEEPYGEIQISKGPNM